MKSPRDMNVIQIEITNACVNRCSNCTRFCGHHRKPFIMDFDTFTKAVQSMKGFKGVVGIMGGEPTLHPEFARFVSYFRENFGFDSLDRVWHRPGQNFINHITKTSFDFTKHNRRGLWSSITPRYVEYFETIQDTFGFQCLNDHSTASMHQPLLVTRKELGISDEKWYELRDACWIQNYWSASISPKGAFFCEIAAALDMLLDGPGGWPIEPGWWERKPEDFTEQLHWCELCSAALPMPSRDARMGIDDISPHWQELLTKIRSPKLRRGTVNIFDIETYCFDQYKVIDNMQPYLSDNRERVVGQRKILAPKNISLYLHIADNSGIPALQTALGSTLLPDRNFVIISDLPEAKAICKEHGVQIFSPTQYTVQEINAATHSTDWVALARNMLPSPSMLKRLSELIFNPGTLYSLRKTGARQAELAFFNTRAESLRESLQLDQLADKFPDGKQYMLPHNFFTQCSLYYPTENSGHDGLPTIFTPVQRDAFQQAGTSTTSIWQNYASDPLFPLLQWVRTNDTESDIVGINGQSDFFLFGKDISPHALIESDKICRDWIKDIPEAMACWDGESLRELLADKDMATAIAVPVRFCNPEWKLCRDWALSRCGDQILQILEDAIATEAPDYVLNFEEILNADSVVMRPFFLMKRCLFEKFFAMADAVLEKALGSQTALRLTADKKHVPTVLLTILLNVFANRAESLAPNSTRQLPYASLRHGAASLHPLPPSQEISDTSVLVVSACDPSSITQFSILLASLCVHAQKDTHYDVVLLSCNISQDAETLLHDQVSEYKNISLRILDCSQLNLPYTHLSIHISDLLLEYDKALYMAPQMLFCTDPKKIYCYDIQRHYCAAVPIAYKLDDKKSLVQIDTSVLLLNLSMIRNSDMQRSLYASLSTKTLIHEIINKTLEGDFLPLPPEASVDVSIKNKGDYPLKLLAGQMKACAQPLALNFVNAQTVLSENNTFFASRYWQIARRSPWYERLLASTNKTGKNSTDIAERALPQLHQIPLPRDVKQKLIHALLPKYAVTQQLLRSGFFDIPFYIAANPDVAKEGVDPVLHYVKFGWKEGRDPAPWFSTKKYLETYPDVAASRLNPFYHYLTYGINEERTI
ncbi:hypothetical protein LJC23_04420 [Desulfovibrio sp. OttesenSCG-928-I05]|nr:hypothetical protein [Desulfovibrio sp. OttesenSCG-928-I05]